MPFFKYGIEETTYLAKKDKRLGEVIEKIGLIQREVIPDMFQALVNSIIGQQISTKAQVSSSARAHARASIRLLTALPPFLRRTSGETPPQSRCPRSPGGGP